MKRSHLSERLACRPPTYVAAASTLLVLFALSAGCSSAKPPASTSNSKTCTTSAECPTGDVCTSGQCVAAPCGGTCTTDQICAVTTTTATCEAAAGYDCSANAAVCPANYMCTSGKCLQTCTMNSMCTQPGFVCNVNTFLCAQCTFNTDCRTGANAAAGKNFCDTATGLCVGCLSDTNCEANGTPDNHYCDMNTLTCKTGCLTVADCPAGSKECLGSSTNADGGMTPGTCIQCQVASQGTDCLDAPDLVCSPTSNECVECVTNSDCAQSTDQCDTASNTCVTCVENSVCPRGQICNTSTFMCEAGCATGSASNCPPDTVCSPSAGTNGTCVACLQDTDCPRTEVCLTNSMGSPACVPGCVTDDRCASTDPTVHNVYCDPVLGQHGTCVECVTSTNCPMNLICDQTTFMCRCHQTGEPCMANSDCGYELVQGEDGGMVGDCNALGATCVNEVRCGQSPYQYTLINSVCGISPAFSTQNQFPDMCPPESAGCPSGSVIEWGANVMTGDPASSGAYTHQCVPAANACQISATGVQCQ